MSANGIRDQVPFGVGAAAGAASWVLGYLCTYVITSSDIQNSLIGQFTDIPTWKAVGWVFFNAHFVDTVVELPVIGGATTFVGGDEGFTALLYVVPPLLLLAAGLAVGRYAGSTDATSAAGGGGGRGPATPAPPTRRARPSVVPRSSSATVCFQSSGSSFSRRRMSRRTR